MTSDGNALARELDAMEDQRDAVTALLARMESANDELLPWAMVKRLSRGENPLLVWREHRDLDAAGLAATSGVAQGDIAAIEAGTLQPSLRQAAALAKALRLNAEDLLPASMD